jgi:alcohol dehydrogenase YqhD (iron-dependent ADH family)
MGHCSDEVMQDSSTKLIEKTIDSKPKEKVKNNTYENIKHIVSGHGKKLDEQGGVKPQPQKNKINIGL